MPLMKDILFIWMIYNVVCWISLLSFGFIMETGHKSYKLYIRQKYVELITRTKTSNVKCVQHA